MLFPQVLLNVRLEPGVDWRANAWLESELAAVESGLSRSGRVLIRASGTEPVLRVMVEAAEEVVARQAAQRLVEAASAR